MGKAQSKSMNVTTADQAKGTVEEGAGKVGKIEEAAPVNGDANHETVRLILAWYSLIFNPRSNKVS